MVFGISFGEGNGKRRYPENDPFKRLAREAKVEAIEHGFDNMSVPKQLMVLFSVQADELDERARARAPSVVVKLGPWIVGGGSFAAIIGLFEALTK